MPTTRQKENVQYNGRLRNENLICCTQCHNFIKGEDDIERERNKIEFVKLSELHNFQAPEPTKDVDLRVPTPSLRLNSLIHKAVERREEPQSHLKWNDFFKSHSSNTKRPKFVLHDGPPYANGSLHVGHALNKFLKDIVLRQKILSGHTVHFIPGWDCHGLPIELKAIEHDPFMSPTKIRKQASQVAKSYIDMQKSSYMDWGILADWSNYYTTMDPQFERNELNAFSRLHEKGLVYRDYSPVHWSPKASTALAESELVYNTEHTSPSLHLRIEMSMLNSFLLRKVPAGSKVYGVIWTTTPWTLPGNESVLYNPDMSYVLLKSLKEYYIVSAQFSEQLSSMLQVPKLIVVDEFLGSNLSNCTYFHPIHSLRVTNENRKPILPATHVVDSKGTGLVHCAPCHGKEDFIVGQEFNLPMNQLIDDKGCFSRDAGSQLFGSSVIEDANDKVLDMVQPMILSLDSVQHSYPYDWRTKTPVVTRLSEQWFVDTAALTDDVLKAYESVSVMPTAHKASMLPFLSSRPRWCISRQRPWGVPIPVLFRRTDGSPIVDQEFIHHISARVAHSGSDFWFHESIEQLVPVEFLSKWNLTADCLTKSTDVFDVWFDSGLSWLTVLGDGHGENAVADLYLEGHDQLRGWFSASLLLSVALFNRAPYRSLVVHGFTADSEGRKMSKSVGNVITPDELVARHKGCVDILRHWAACAALDSVSTVGTKEIDEHAASYKALNEDEEIFTFSEIRLALLMSNGSGFGIELRNALRFMMGNLSDFQPATHLANLKSGTPMPPTSINEIVFQLIQTTLPNATVCTELTASDRAVLAWLGRLVRNSLHDYYPNWRFNTLLSELAQFLSKLSSIYFTANKDTLYCDPPQSADRQSVQAVFWIITEVLKALLAPIVPFLMEEVEQASCSQWRLDPLLTNLNQMPISLLERYASCSQNPVDPATSDWSVCLAAAEQWTAFDECADMITLIHNLHQQIVQDGFSTRNPAGSSVNPLACYHVSVQLPDSTPQSETAVSSALQFLHPSSIEPSNSSELCKLLRAASVKWCVGSTLNHVEKPTAPGRQLQLQSRGIPVIVSLFEAVDETRCPRCMKYTGSASTPLCPRCTEVLFVQERRCAA